jgi:NADH-quinone oxidoreductase subunit J
LILFLFAIFLTNPKGDAVEPRDKRRVLLGIVGSLGGAVVAGFIILKQFYLYPVPDTAIGDHELSMKIIGTALIGTEKYQYLLPFEALSVLLLACIIGGILIARKS